MAQILGELIRRPGSGRITGRIRGQRVALVRSKTRRDAGGELVEVWQLCLTDEAERVPRREADQPAGALDRH